MHFFIKQVGDWPQDTLISLKVMTILVNYNPKYHSTLHINTFDLSSLYTHFSGTTSYAKSISRLYSLPAHN